MIFKDLSDMAILKEMGQRLAQTRLRQNLSQAALSKRTGVSRRTIQKTEDGEVATLKTLVTLLRGLGQLEQLEQLLIQEPPSPLQRANGRVHPRQRASRPRSNKPPSQSSANVGELTS